MFVKKVFLPEYRSQIITIDFLRGCRDGNIETFKLEQCHPVHVPYKPTIKKLREMVVELCGAFAASPQRKMLGAYVEKYSADQNWLLILLQKLNPFNEIY